MPNYMVRVELKGNPDTVSYLKLHATTAIQGFLRVADGQPLPHATYYGASSKSPDELSGHLLSVIRRDIQYDVLVAAALTTTVSVNGQSYFMSLGKLKGLSFLYQGQS